MNSQTDPQKIMEKGKNAVSEGTKNAFQSASNLVSRSSGVKQFAIGTASGWCTGFLATRVGKTVAISVGGSIILIAAANQAGLVHINWERFGKKIEETACKAENKIPAIQSNVGKYARNNKMFAVGFVGGFLLGIAS